MTTPFSQLYEVSLAYYIQGGKEFGNVTSVDMERVRKVQLCSKSNKENNFLGLSQLIGSWKNNPNGRTVQYSMYFIFKDY